MKSLNKGYGRETKQNWFQKEKKDYIRGMLAVFSPEYVVSLLSISECKQQSVLVTDSETMAWFT
jgi:hypothetical protein